jgi:hypothetical protein
MRVHVVFLERENHPLAVVLEAILQSRRILAGQPEIQGMPRYLSERFLRMPLQTSRHLPPLTGDRAGEPPPALSQLY